MGTRSDLESMASLFRPNSNASRVDVSRQSEDGQKRECVLARTSRRTRGVSCNSSSSDVWKGRLCERPKHHSWAVLRLRSRLSGEHRYDGLLPDEQENHVRTSPL